MQRRDFMKTAAVTAVSLAAAGVAIAQNGIATAAGTVKRIPISVQLYSVRQMAQNDLLAALTGLKKIGYEAVEFAGYYGREKDMNGIKDIRKMLDDCGLKASGSHTRLSELMGDSFRKTIDIHHILGAEYIAVPGGIDKYLHVAVASESLGFLFNELADKVEKEGLRFGYHAHGGDAKLVDGVPAWDRFFANTKPNVFAQMDVGNYMAGGGDSYGSLEKFPGLAFSVHLKSHGNNGAPIGKDTVDWKRVFDFCETKGGTKWYVVEEEKYPNSFEGVAACFEGLKEMGKTL